MGTEAKQHSEGCPERIRQAMMNDDMGQQRLQKAEQRRATTEGHLTFPKVEVAQEGQDVEMTATHAASKAEGSEVAGWKTFLCRGNVERRKWIRQTTGHVR